MTWLRNVILIVLLGGACFWGWHFYKSRYSAPVFSYHTTPVQRGELLATIGATGTLEPEEVVDVGAQVAGMIVSFGPDAARISRPIDYNSEVNQGDVLAKIDDVLYQADLHTAQAAKDSAVANVAKAQADMKQYEAKALQAKRDWDRAREQKAGELMSQAEKDGFEAAFDSGNANVDSAKASVALAQAGVGSADAVLDRAKKNLEYCIIKSPVKGVIIDRRVSIGQTVVSSLSAPSLFLLAKDLTRMQIWASVNETDIGNIYEGQPVTFTVDKVPDRIFNGKVSKIRMNAQTTQNVVTYTIEINYDNSDRALIPYLTTNVLFEKSRHENVLLVPNAALRWAPTNPLQVLPDARESAMSVSHGSTKPASAKSTTGPTTRRTDGVRRHGRIWVKDGDFVRPIRVKLGETDNQSTEVSSDDKDTVLKENMEVVISEVRPEEASAEAKNPFMPQFGQRRGAGR